MTKHLDLGICMCVHGRMNDVKAVREYRAGWEMHYGGGQIDCVRTERKPLAQSSR